MFFKRYYRRGARRRFFRRSLKRARGSKSVNSYNSFRFLIRKPRRRRFISRGLRSAINEVIGGKFNLRQAVGSYQLEPSASYAGATIVGWIHPGILEALYAWARSITLNRYVAPSVSPASILRYNWNFGCKFQKIGYIWELTNTANYPIDVRVIEFFAKRDIPANVCNDDAGNWRDPVNSMYTYEAQGGRPAQTVATSTAYPTNNFTYSFFMNRFQSFPTINFWFRHRVTQTAKLQPGASLPITWLYTPKIGLYPSQMFYTATQTQDFTATTGYGWGMLKGLNGSICMIEIRGQPVMNNATALPITAQAALRMNVTAVTELTMVPFKEDATYSYMDGTFLANNTNIRVPGMEIVNQQNASIY